MRKKNEKKIYGSGFLAALILSLAVSSSALSEIIVEPDKNVEEQVVEGVKQVVQHFNTILSEELKISLTEKVTIYVCANQESFQIPRIILLLLLLALAPLLIVDSLEGIKAFRQYQ